MATIGTFSARFACCSVSIFAGAANGFEEEG